MVTRPVGPDDETRVSGSEIAEEIAFPPEINNFWPDCGYYGTPANNHERVQQALYGLVWTAICVGSRRLTPQAAAKNISSMGGEAAILGQRLRRILDNGDYRPPWCFKHVVFANPDSVNGKNLSPTAASSLATRLSPGQAFVYLPQARTNCAMGY